MTRRRGLIPLAALVVGGLLCARPALAHEKWFHTTEGFPLRPDLLFQPKPLEFVAGVLLLTALLGLWWRGRGGRGFVPGPESFGADPERRSALYGLIPAILAVHLAVPLLVDGVQGHLFSPDNVLPGAWRYFLGLAETGIALALFYGTLTRLAAALMALLWLLGVFVVGPQGMLDNCLYLGFAAFFFLAGRGPVSIDRLVVPRWEPSPAQMEQSVAALRIGLGLSLTVVAFTEKLANLPLALDFLRDYHLNFTRFVGVPMSDEIFILCAGSVELIVGLCLLFNIFPREIILIAWIPINMSLTVFNWTELIGHLPIYGILAFLLLWAPGPENLALWRLGLRAGPVPVQADRQDRH